MIKKTVRPLFFYIVFFILIFSLLGHVLYGSCQTSKYHYFIQCFYGPTYLPKWMWASNFRDDEEAGGKYLTVYKNYSGKWCAWYEDGGYIEINYLNGKLHGVEKAWDKNGVMFYKSEFKNGNANGKREYWFKNGVKESELNRVDDKLQGKDTRWNTNGMKFYEVNYVNDEKDGKQSVWYENGNKCREIDYVMGKMHGKVFEFYENGNKKSIKEYKNDEEISSEEWDEKGNCINLVSSK